MSKQKIPKYKAQQKNVSLIILRLCFNYNCHVEKIVQKLKFFF